MSIKFNNSKELIPAIIQDNNTRQVLMLGYMNEEAFEKTIELQKVTFFSRSKQRLWTKGETSGNFLQFISAKMDCDNDTLLIQVNPSGATCHTGSDTCWQDKNIDNSLSFLNQLETTIKDRLNNPSEDSYVSTLAKRGVNKIAQKVGEEAVELVIEAKDDNDDLFIDEAADLLFHYTLLLNHKGFELSDVVNTLKSRHHK